MGMANGDEDTGLSLSPDLQGYVTGQNQLFPPPASTPTLAQSSGFDMAFGDSIATQQHNHGMWGNTGPQYNSKNPAPFDIWHTNAVGDPTSRVLDRANWLLDQNPDYFRNKNIFLSANANSPNDTASFGRLLDTMKEAGAANVVVPGLGPGIKNQSAVNKSIQNMVEQRGFTYFEPNMTRGWDSAQQIHPNYPPEMTNQAMAALAQARQASTTVPTTAPNVGTPRGLVPVQEGQYGSANLQPGYQNAPQGFTVSDTPGSQTQQPIAPGQYASATPGQEPATLPVNPPYSPPISGPATGPPINLVPPPAEPAVRYSAPQEFDPQLYPRGGLLPRPSGALAPAPSAPISLPAPFQPTIVEGGASRARTGSPLDYAWPPLTPNDLGGVAGRNTLVSGFPAVGTDTSHIVYNRPPQSPYPTAEQAATDIDRLNKTIYARETDSGRNITVSTAGARGPMQIMPGTFADNALPGERIDDFNDNMRVGQRIIANLYKKYNGDLDAVLVGYNAGEKYIGRPFDKLPKETQDYIIKSHKDWGYENPSQYTPYVAGQMRPPVAGMYSGDVVPGTNFAIGGQLAFAPPPQMFTGPEAPGGGGRPASGPVVAGNGQGGGPAGDTGAGAASRAEANQRALASLQGPGSSNDRLRGFQLLALASSLIKPKIPLNPYDPASTIPKGRPPGVGEMPIAQRIEAPPVGRRVAGRLFY